MADNITNILKKLELDEYGRYENHFYIIDLKDSDDYARMYTKLNNTAKALEEPSIETNTNKTTTKIINYYEIEENNVDYKIFLFANFENDKYYIKIGENK